MLFTGLNVSATLVMSAFVMCFGFIGSRASAFPSIDQPGLRLVPLAFIASILSHASRATSLFSHSLVLMKNWLSLTWAAIGSPMRNFGDFFARCS